MRLTIVFNVVIVVTAVALVIYILARSSERPELMPELAGCYAAVVSGERQTITVTAEGMLSYRAQQSRVVPYEDKQSISFLPKTKIVSGERGDIQFTSGYPYLLRVDSDRGGFTVPGEGGDPVRFRKFAC